MDNKELVEVISITAGELVCDMTVSLDPLHGDALIRGADGRIILHLTLEGGPKGPLTPREDILVLHRLVAHASAYFARYEGGS